MPDDKLVIRNYKAGDDKWIEDIVKLAWPKVTLWKKIEDVYGPRGGKPWWRYKLDPVISLGRMNPRQVIIAEFDGKIVGYAAYMTNDETKIGQVMDNAVNPDFSGKGIGSAMHKKVLKAMQQAGMEIAKVGTGIDEDQAPARKLYEKHGFKEVYVEKFYLRSLKDLEF